MVWLWTWDVFNVYPQLFILKSNKSRSGVDLCSGACCGHSLNQLVSNFIKMMCNFVQSCNRTNNCSKWLNVILCFDVSLHLLPSMVPFPFIKQNLGLMVSINAASVPVALEIARLVQQLKAHVVHWGARTIPSLFMFYMTWLFSSTHSPVSNELKEMLLSYFIDRD